MVYPCPKGFSGSAIATGCHQATAGSHPQPLRQNFGDPRDGRMHGASSIKLLHKSTDIYIYIYIYYHILSISIYLFTIIVNIITLLLLSPLILPWLLLYI
jgi:hypothetical protein